MKDMYDDELSFGAHRSRRESQVAVRCYREEQSVSNFVDQILDDDIDAPASKASKTHGIAIQFTQDESKAWRVQVIKENGPAWFVVRFTRNS